MTRAAHDCGNGVYTQVVMDRFQVHCPYNAEFILFAHRNEGRYRHRSGIWSFRRHQFPAVAQRLNELFGTKIRYQEVP